jgi:hypothetical protein
MKDDTVEALDLLCEIAESGETRFAARTFDGRASAVSVLIRAEILTRDGVVSSVVCDACDEVHEATLEYFPKGECHGWYCPNVGRIEADAGAVIALSFSIERVVSRLCEAFRETFGPPRWRTRLIEGTRSWIVAAFKIGAADTTLVLASGLRATSAAQALHNALAGLPQNDAGLVLVTDDQELLPPLPKRLRSLPLQAAVQLRENGSFEVDAHLVRRAIGSARSDTRGRAGRPSLEQSVWCILDAIGADPDSQRLAAAVRTAWPDYFPDDEMPKRTSLKNHVSAWRTARR